MKSFFFIKHKSFFLCRKKFGKKSLNFEDGFVISVFAVFFFNVMVSIVVNEYLNKMSTIHCVLAEVYRKKIIKNWVGIQIKGYIVGEEVKKISFQFLT